MLKNRLAVAAITVAALTLVPAGGAAASGCDPLDTRSCLLPFPSNFNTVAQKGSDTSLRLNFSASQFPKNVKGKSGFPPELNRNDGFSPGSALLAVVHSTVRGSRKAVQDAIFESGASNLSTVHQDFEDYGVAYDLLALDRPLTDAQLAGIAAHAAAVTREPNAVRSLRQLLVD